MNKELIDRFVGRLEVLAGKLPETRPDRRALAGLQRCLSTWPIAPPEAMQVVGPFLPVEATGWRETMFYLVGGLFAQHPCLPESSSAGQWGLGRSLRKAASGDASGGAERRLLALLNCRSEDLPVHLRHTVAFLRSRDVPIDYRRLMADLDWWDYGGGSVQRRWGREYWGSLGEADSPTEQEKD